MQFIEAVKICFELCLALIGIISFRMTEYYNLADLGTQIMEQLNKRDQRQHTRANITRVNSRQCLIAYNTIKHVISRGQPVKYIFYSNRSRVRWFVMVILMTTTYIR